MNRIYDNFGCIPANHIICFVVILVTLSKVDKVSFIKSTLSYLVLVVILCYLVLVVNFILPCSCGQFYPTLYLWSTLSYLVLVVNFILYLVLVVNFILYLLLVVNFILYLVLVVNVILPCTVRVVNFILPCTSGQLYPTLYLWSTLEKPTVGAMLSRLCPTMDLVTTFQTKWPPQTLLHVSRGTVLQRFK